MLLHSLEFSSFNVLYSVFSSIKPSICLYFLTFIQTIARTKDNVVKKQALTYEEIEAEREEVS